MENHKIAFQIHQRDNVATVLEKAGQGETIDLTGDGKEKEITAVTEIPTGHKIALGDIAFGENIIKYGVVIGRATADIPKGSWVHLHVMQSIYDQRSSHLDIQTGAPKDTRYE